MLSINGIIKGRNLLEELTKEGELEFLVITADGYSFRFYISLNSFNIALM